MCDEINENGVTYSKRKFSDDNLTLSGHSSTWIDYRSRLRTLESMLLDPKSCCYLEGLLDVITNLVEDCKYLSRSKTNKHYNAIFERFEEAAREIESHRMRYSDFDLLKVIGEGAFGQVQLVRERSSSRVMAMKLLDKKQMLEQSGSAFFWEEREVMAHANSDWIVKIFYAFQDATHLYMVMEFLPGGNLVNWMDMLEVVSENDARFYVAEVVLSLEALHDMGFVHRDVKPDNMLLDARGHLKLADFGTCVRVDARTGLVSCDTAVGTPDYISPEVLLSQNSSGTYGREVDWWALGVFLYELLYAETPFYSESLVNTYSKIMNHSNTLAFPLDPPLTPVTLDFMKRLLCDRETRLGRLGASEVQAHPFFSTEEWTWEDIRMRTPPYVPQLTGDSDTSNFDICDNVGSNASSGSSNRYKKANNSQAQQPWAGSDNNSSSKQFTAENLSFSGFSFYSPEASLFSQGANLTGSSSTNNTSEKYQLDLASAHELNKGLQLAMTRLESQLEEALADCEMHVGENDQLQRKVAELERQNSRLKHDYESVEQQNQATIQQFHSRLEQIKSDSSKTINEKSKLENELQRLQLSLKDETSQKNEMEKSLKDSNIRIRQLNDEHLELTKSLESMEQIKNGLQIENSNLEKKWRTIEIELSALKDKYQRLQQENEKKKESNEEKIFTANKAEKEELQARLVVLEKEKTELQFDVNNLTRQLTALREDSVRSRTVEEQQIKVDLERVKCQLRDAISKRIKAEKDSEDLRERLETERHFSGLYKGQLDEKDEELNVQMAELETVKREYKINLSAMSDYQRQLDEATQRYKNNSEDVRRIQRLYKEQVNKEAKTIEDLKTVHKITVESLENKVSELSNKLLAAEQKLEFSLAEIEKEKMKCKSAVDKLQDVLMGGNIQAVEIINQSQKGSRGTGKVPSEVYRKLDRKYKLLEADMAKLESLRKREIADLQEQLDDTQNRLNDLEVQNQRLSEELQQRNQEFDALLPLLPNGGASSSSSMDSTHNQSVSSGLGLSALHGSPGRKSSLTIATSSPNSSLSGGDTSIMSSSTLLSTASQDGVLEVLTKGKQGRQKMLWESRFIKISDNSLVFYEKEQPVMELSFSKMVHVRSVNQCDMIHANKNDLPRIFQIFYDLATVNSASHSDLCNSSGSSFTLPSAPTTPNISASHASQFSMTLSRKFSLSSSVETPLDPGIVNPNSPYPVHSYQGHVLQKMNFRVPTFCDYCRRSCFNVVKPPECYQCLHCHMKLHKDHVTQKVKIQACNKATKIYFLRASSPAEKDRWLGLLEALLKKLSTSNTPQQTPKLTKMSLAHYGKCMTLPPNATPPRFDSSIDGT